MSRILEDAQVGNRLNNSSSFGIESEFSDTIRDIRKIKIELFGNPEANMDFYKRNKNAYDARILQRSMKIAKILELESLLQLNYSHPMKKTIRNRKLSSLKEIGDKIDPRLEPVNYNSLITPNSSDYRTTAKIDSSSIKFNFTISDQSKLQKLKKTLNKNKTKSNEDVVLVSKRNYD